MKLVFNGTSSKREDKLTMKDYWKLIKILHLAEYKCALRINPHWVFQPFDKWDAEKINYEPLLWYQTYSKGKHNRASMIRHATFEKLLNSYAALFVLQVVIAGPYACIPGAIPGMGNLIFQLDDGISNSDSQTIFYLTDEPKFNEEEKYNITNINEINIVESRLE